MNKIVCLIASALLIAQNSNAQASDLVENNFSASEREFIENWLRDLPKLEAQYHDLEVHASITQRLGPDGDGSEATSSLLFYSLGSDLRRLDESGIQKNKEGEEFDITEVSMLNEHGFLVARNEGKDSQMVLVDLIADAETGMQKITFDAGIPSSAYCVFGAPLARLLTAPPPVYEDYRLTQFESIELDGREAIRIRADFRAGEEVGDWEVKLDRQTQVVVEYKMGGKMPERDGQWRHGRVEYDFSGNVPIIRKLTTWAVAGPKQENYNTRTVNVSRFDFDAPDRDLFYPASIGLDIDYGENSGFLLYTSIAIVLVVAAIALRGRKVAKAE